MPKPHDSGGHVITMPIEIRLQMLLSLLEQRGLRLPESPIQKGHPHITLVAHFLSADESSFGFVRGSPRSARVLLQQATLRIGLMPADEFIRHMSDEDRVPSHRPDETMEKILEWAEELREHGIGLPCKPSGKVDLAGIARLFDTAPAKIYSSKYPYKRALIDLSSELGLIPTGEFNSVAPRPVPRDSNADQLEAEVEKLRDFLIRRFVLSRRGLPESPRRRGDPYLRAIALEFGKDPHAFKNEPKFVAVVTWAARLTGVGPDRYIRKGAADVTYHDLLIVFDAVHSDASEAIRAKARWARNKLMECLNRSEESAVGTDLTDDFERSLSAAQGRIMSDASAKQFEAEARRWQAVAFLLARTMSAEADSFKARLNNALRERGIDNLRSFLRSCDLEHIYHTVHTWSRFGSEPLNTEAWVLEHLEDALGCSPGYLTGSVSPYRSKRSLMMTVGAWPASLQTNLLRKLARPLLPPDFAYLPAHEREQIGEQIVREAHGYIEYRRRMRIAIRKKQAVNRNKVPLRLRRELDALYRYKTSLVPTEMRHTKWRHSTKDLAHGFLISFFSNIAAPPEEMAEDEERLGPRVPSEALTLAMIAVPKLVTYHLESLLDATRDGEAPHGGIRNFVMLAAHLASPSASDPKRTKSRAMGYLRYRAELAQNLTPIPGFLSESQIETLRTIEGWEASLDQVHKECWQFFRDVEGRWTPSRDPFEPIAPILEMERPLDALMNMLTSMHKDIPTNLEVSSMRRAVAIRRFVLCLLLVRTGLRRLNLSQLTWFDNGAGRICKLDGSYMIELPAHLFKNEKSAFFRASRHRRSREAVYKVRLPEEDTPIIDEYVNIARPILNAANPRNEAFFVTNKGNKLSPEAISADITFLTWIYLVRHECTNSGINGVSHFGPHAFRDIIATHILKVTGNVSLAAAAIQDTEETVLEYYGHFLAKDKTELVMRFLAADLSPGIWDCPAA